MAHASLSPAASLAPTASLGSAVYKHPAASLNPAAIGTMESEGYFDANAYAERNKPAHPISQYRHRLNLESISKGLPQGSVPLMGMEPGPGRSQVMNSLLESLSRSDLGVDPKGARFDENSDKRLAAYGDGWKLKVYGDGSRVQFRNYGHMDKHEESLAKMQRMEPEQLVKLGRDFVFNVLGEQVRLGQGEELVPFGVQYQVNAQQSAKGGEPEQSTVAAAVVFSRTLNGVDVLGKGSKVAVLYTNDGTPFGFDFDWPALYHTGMEQKVAPVQELQQRAVKVARLEGSATNVQLERFECGYYDAGQSKRSGAPMQPACFHFYSAQSKAEAEDGESGLLTMAFVDAVPAGTEIVADENWDTALELLYGPEAVPERAKPGEDSAVRADLSTFARPDKGSKF